MIIVLMYPAFGFLSICIVLLLSVSAAAEIPTARMRAVEVTAAHAAQCKKLGDFYWEIGDKNSTLASGVVGAKYSPHKVIDIASASKWVFGSYVLEKIGKHNEPSEQQIQALEMLSGYTSLRFGRCRFARTVEDCFNHRGNDEFSEENVGEFYYNGGHDQKLAIELGLGAKNSAEFGRELRRYLGNDLDFDFSSPQPAGGMTASPAGYGKFLRKILAGDLRMKNYLDFQPVCTLPKKCPTAVESPAPAAWHYSLNHWIEDDDIGDGAFSSPGAFGFYPWISADKQWYGILARESHWPNTYKDSVYCGVKLRKAWLTGAEQL